MRRVILLASLAALLASCGGSSGPGGGDVDVKLDALTVQPGEDQVYCQYLPADGKSRWLSSFTTDMTPGSHHLIVFRVDESKGRVPEPARRVCDQLELPPGVDGMLPGSQEPHTALVLPDGAAMELGPEHGLFFQFHYYNAGDAPLVANIRWHAGTMPAEDVKVPAGMMFYSNFSLQVPPGKSTASHTCAVPSDRRLLGASGHMHRRGVGFDATLDGVPIYHADSWAEPPLTSFGSGLTAPRGARLTWSCDYENGDGKTYTFGPSATANEMCIFAAIYTPAPDSATDFGCFD
jgi:hypothetical protein